MKRLFLLITGLKWARIGEWRGVVASEGKRIGWISTGVALAKGVWGLGGVDRARWRSRLRTCAQCPVYDARRHACRDTAGRGLGCGCWMPAKALTLQNACWLRQIDPAAGFR